jgi:RNA polymerase sporulation-specific sigma factor
MENTLELIERSQLGDKLAREQLVKENIGLVWSVVKKFSHRGYDIDDLFQIGSIGLIKSIDKFDATYNVKFSTYAVPMIMGEIKRFIRDDGMIKVSRSLKEIAGKIREAREELHRQTSREPTISEIARKVGITVEEAVMAIESNSEVESLYKTIYQGDGSPIYLIDKLDKLCDESSKMVDVIALKQIITELPEKEKEIIYLRYYQDRTQTEIAEKIGISQVQVSRLEKKILSRLRQKLS